MPDYLVQCVLSHDSGLPADVTVNNWSWTASSVGDLEDVMGGLGSFYESIDQYLSVNLSGLLTMKAYDRADPTPRSPVHIETRSLTVGSTALPDQVALCLSFQGAKVSGLPQARRRGRVYLGPFYSAANVTNTGLPDATFVGAVRTAAETLLVYSDTEPNISWNVWSSVLGNDAVVVDGWVDNRWDTQRRRLRPATSRVIFPD